MLLLHQQRYCLYWVRSHQSEASFQEKPRKRRQRQILIEHNRPACWRCLSPLCQPLLDWRFSLNYSSRSAPVMIVNNIYNYVKISNHQAVPLRYWYSFWCFLSTSTSISFRYSWTSEDRGLYILLKFSASSLYFKRPRRKFDTPKPSHAADELDLSSTALLKVTLASSQLFLWR